MPRKSLSQLTTPTTSIDRRIVPRAGVPDEVGELFRQIVSQVDSDHFVQSDSALLESYCEAVVLSRQAYESLSEQGLLTDAGKTNPYLALHEKMGRSMVALAARLRICPQSRFDRLKAGTTARGSKPAVDWGAA